MEKKEQPIIFDDIFDEGICKDDPNKQQIPEIPPGGRTAADMKHDLELGEDIGGWLRRLARKIRGK